MQLYTPACIVCPCIPTNVVPARATLFNFIQHTSIIFFMKILLLLVMLFLCSSLSVSADYHLSISNLQTVYENGADGSFTISVNADGSSPGTDSLTVNFSVSGDDAQMGVDYVAFPLIVKIPVVAGSGSITVPVHAINDNIMEYPEAFAIVIQSAIAQSGVKVILPERPGFVGIDDDDEKVITFKGKTDGIEGVTDPTVTVGLEDGFITANPIQIRYGIVSSANLDEPNIVIPAGQNSVTVPISLIDDQKVGGTKHITMNLVEAYGGPDNSIFYVAIGTIDISVFDNDTVPVAVGRLRLFNGNNLTSGESGVGTGSVNLLFESLGDLPFTEPITVTFTLGGSATNGSDYMLQTAVIPVFETAYNWVKVPIPALDDNIIEGPEFVQVHISNITTPPGATINYYPNDEAFVSIIDNDTSLITIAAATNGTEGGQAASITLSYSGDLVAAEDVHIAYHFDSSGTTATQGADFTMPDAVIPAGEHSATIPITITNDNDIESTEYIKIVTDSAYGDKLNYAIGPVKNKVVSIADNDRTNTHCPPGKFIIPNVLTPNGDGRDDKFIIRGLEKYPGSKLFIYNLLRGGRLVYQSKDYKNDWAGEGCYQGLYSYQLEVKEDGRWKIYRGMLVIIR